MKTSEQLFKCARQYIPGGVNSPVRAFKGVGGTPVYFKGAQGAYLFDVEDRRYIDYVGSWGPMIMGHNHPDVINAVKNQLESGMSFGAPTEIETLLAEKICQLMPAIEQIRMVNSGTEATMSAIRLARGYTGRNKIIKFEGCYHGHADSLLVKAGSGLLTSGIPTSAGVPSDIIQNTLSLTFNDSSSVKEAFASYGDDIACVIVEPVAGNMNCILPLPDFLAELKSICNQYGSLLIFDEVMTGFRVGPGGAQGYYNVMPDLTTLGKIIGGGMPVGAFGGRAHIMQHLAPRGPVYQAGTLSGNPVAMTAGLATLELLTQNQPLYEKLAHHINILLEGLQRQADYHGIPLVTQSIGGMFGIFFAAEPVLTFNQAVSCNIEHFRQFFHSMLRQGVYLAPSAFEAGFISNAHTLEDIEQTINCSEAAFREINNEAI